MKNLAFTLVFALLSSVGFSQQRLDFTGTGETDYTSGYFSKYVATDKYEDIEGSPYFNSTWEVGTITLKSGIVLKIESFKYDVYEAKLLFLKDEKPLYFATPEDIESFTIGSNKFINLRQKGMNDYYEKIIEGDDFNLLKEYSCTFVQGKETDGITPKTKDRYKVNSSYYLQEGEKDLQKLKFNEKSILEITGNRQDEIKNYIKENKLNCKKEEDVIKILDFYSSL